MKQQRSLTVKKKRDGGEPMPKDIGMGVLPPELRTLFDRVSDHFPGHTMQRMRLPNGQIRYTYASPGMRETFGLDPATILAEKTASHDWLHAEDRDRFIAAVHRSADRLETLDEEVRVNASDGTTRWVRSIGHPRALPDGSVVWDGIALDVTARRETEAALERMVHLAREAEAAGSTLVRGEPGRLGRSLAAIGRHLDALSRVVPAEAISHLDEIRAELSTLLQSGTVSVPAVALTPRHRDVLELVAHGATNREIGDRLGIDPGTVKVHVAALLKRLKAPNRTAAVALAREQGLV